MGENMLNYGLNSLQIFKMTQRMEISRGYAFACKKRYVVCMAGCVNRACSRALSQRQANVSFGIPCVLQRAVPPGA